MEIIGYIGAILVGVCLGLIGGGGSILTVPILVYLFGLNPALATSYSLFVVGSTSSVGALSHSKMGDVDWKAVIFFGLPSVVTVFITRHWLVPILPDPWLKAGNYDITKSEGLLFLFGMLMLAASIKMITAKKQTNQQQKSSSTITVVAQGLVLGVITGLLGAGGGFLIIPALILLMRLDMKKAIGSSLVIIAINSLVGFLGSLHHEEKGSIDWRFLIEFTAIAIAGIIAGSILSKKVSSEKLKPAFGWFVLVMGVYIIAKELLN
jgi:uncharacterized membrane protein YfcA